MGSGQRTVDSEQRSVGQWDSGTVGQWEEASVEHRVLGVGLRAVLCD